MFYNTMRIDFCCGGLYHRTWLQYHACISHSSVQEEIIERAANLIFPHNEILISVDIIPNSIVLAQAANESAWGTSRFAKEYNAFFGEYTYDFSKGVIPLNREEGKKHLVKSFSSFDKSVESYFKNIHSHRAYKKFRLIRKLMRDKNNFSNVSLLVETLNSYAEDDNYIGTINSIIESNNLYKFDIVSYTPSRS